MLPENCIYKQRFAFIPHRLNIAERPELEDFPYNVLFVSYKRVDGVDISGTALYEPELKSYNVIPGKHRLGYRNIYGRENLLVITKDKKRWEGIKLINCERVLWATGINWRQFFIHLTISGLANKEKCKFDKLDSPLIAE